MTSLNDCGNVNGEKTLCWPSTCISTSTYKLGIGQIRRHIGDANLAGNN